MSDLQVTCLGTASQQPSVKRALNSCVYRNKGISYLVDCGEGTQAQLTASGVRPSSIKTVLITHLHGDHCFGLPDTGSLLEAVKKVKYEYPTIEVYGPVGLRRYLRVALQLSRSRLACNYIVHELVPTQAQIGGSHPSFDSWNPPANDDFERYYNELPGRQIYPTDYHGQNIWKLCKDSNNVTVTAVELLHHAPSFGYVFEEPSIIGLLDKERLEHLGLRNSPLCGKLARGNEVEHNGRIIKPCDVQRPEVKGRKVAVLGDSRDSNLASNYCHAADLIMHEATLENDMESTAIEHGHSTPRMAVEFARRCGAKKLVLNHFSQRYRSEKDEKYNLEESITDQILLKQAIQCALELGESENFVGIARDLKVIDVIRAK
ncbi:unnamed protein product [Oikopleura dioica]|uniref:Metallo-beta-lactamase domain-containing protein n=1 Tax=Oikopleura dioica TaxID=34765 RepID=E4YP93_OIKDI|nr:unnamed protein product [Oikopleura dioica]